MLRLAPLLTIMLFISTGYTDLGNDDSTLQHPVYQKVNKAANALKFINGYIANCKKLNDNVDMVAWVNSNNLTTKRFKSELKRIVDDAYKNEPEVGLDFDPILDAQDNPDKGFELESFDEQKNVLTLKGKDWHEFKLAMRIVEENGNWLVDGCGIVNMPNAKEGK
jgi:hypothetical protein